MRHTRSPHQQAATLSDWWPERSTQSYGITVIRRGTWASTLTALLDALGGQARLIALVPFARNVVASGKRG